MESIDTQQGIDELVAAFEGLSLPRERWDHAAHLAVGLVYVLRYGPSGALQQLGARIPKYNLATGRTERERSGYRDDVTRFFVYAIHGEIAGREERGCAALLMELSSGPLAVWQRPVGAEV